LADDVVDRGHVMSDLLDLRSTRCIRPDTP